eukprot:m51a1_g3780 hypothetical protein (331) ;mRNA; f:157042-158034
MSRKLVLHLDVNGTVVLTDLACGYDPHEAISIHLAGLFWSPAPATADSRWQFALSAPTPDSVSFYKYHESLIGSAYESRTAFKRRMGAFGLDKSWFAHDEFAELVDAVTVAEADLQSLSSEERDVLTIPLCEGSEQRAWFVVPSFWVALDELRLGNVGCDDYAIAFRTFGEDSSRLIKVLKLYEAGRIPGTSRSADLRELRIRSEPLRLRREAQDLELVGSEKGKDMVVARGEEAVRQFFDDLEGGSLVAVRDDYDHWSGSGFAASEGKPVWGGHNSIVHAAADDFADTIIDWRGSASARLVTKAMLVESLKDKHYFLEMARAAMRTTTA